MIVVGNRILVTLFDQSGKEVETFTVRAQTMHASLRMAARLYRAYSQAGPLMARAERYDFQAVWDAVNEDHERKYNANAWLAIYKDGHLVFGAGEHHPFLDLIEFCDHENGKTSYDRSVILAEERFAKKGKHLKISHDTNVGLTLTIDNLHARCGIIFRHQNAKTFNFMADPKKGRNEPVTISHCLNVAAAFIEGIDLARFLGMHNEKLRLKLVERFGTDDRKADLARRRFAPLNLEIKSFENMFDVRYRPEKPEFHLIIPETKKHFRETYKFSAPPQASDRGETPPA